MEPELPFSLHVKTIPNPLIGVFAISPDKKTLSLVSKDNIGVLSLTRSTYVDITFFSMRGDIPSCPAVIDGFLRNVYCSTSERLQNLGVFDVPEEVKTDMVMYYNRGFNWGGMEFNYSYEEETFKFNVHHMESVENLLRA